MTQLKVKDYPGLVRDSRSKAIINIDSEALKEHQNKKIVHSKMINITEEIDDLKESVNEIKYLLTQLITNQKDEKK